MKTRLKKLWEWFNGKKTSIGVIGLSICSLNITEKNIDVDTLELLKLIFSLIGGIGIAHRDMKSDKSIIKRINKNIANSVKKQ